MTRALTALAAVASAVILGSCGGGGATASNTGGNVQILPSGGTFYAGVAYQFQVVGGSVPYVVSSSEPDLFPVPSQLEGHSFTVIPNNPGVVDVGLQPGALPGRTVIITARDKNGISATTPSTGGVFVAQNFFTGYGLQFISACAAAAGGGAAPQACPGGESIVSATAVTNGGLFGNRQFRFDVIRGPFGFIDCDPVQTPNANAPVLNTLTCRTDHEGKANVRLRVSTGVAAQLATIRLTDVASGAVTTHIFAISGSVAGVLTVIPDDIKIAGSLSNNCGRSTAGALIFDGTQPYTATSSNGNFSAVVSGNQMTVTSSGACESGTIVVQDAAGRRATVAVEATAGTTAPVALTVSPTTVNLNATCGFVSSVAVIGGANTGLTAVSTHTRVNAVISGNVISVSRAASGDGATVFPNNATITITDGAAFASITVSNVAGNCP